MKRIISWLKGLFRKEVDTVDWRKLADEQFDELCIKAKREEEELKKEEERRIFLTNLEKEMEEATNSMSMLEAYREYKRKCNDKGDS